MDQNRSGKGGPSPQAKTGDDRQQRLAAALRANLKKRKIQGRARAAGEALPAAESADTPDNPPRVP